MSVSETAPVVVTVLLIGEDVAAAATMEAVLKVSDDVVDDDALLVFIRLCVRFNRRDSDIFFLYGIMTVMMNE